MTADTRFTLRDLPFPAKLVVTCFLLAVGFGYTAALAQLHYKDSKSGETMPTPHDVVLKFTGKKWFSTQQEPPPSLFVRLITTPTGSFNRSGTMMPAFFEKDPTFTRTLRNSSPESQAQLRAEREGERDALVLWAKAPAEERKSAYTNDHFGIPADQMPKAITLEFKSADDAVKVKSILNARCVRCHTSNANESDDSKAVNFPLNTYEQIDKYLQVADVTAVPPGGGWVKVEEPMGLEALTQSTHAHLLSFAVLFSLTGLTFAFTSYPVIVRSIIAPLAVVAIVTDVTFWWLARLSDGYGVYFSYAILGTGGTAGLALMAQIVLSCWNMYGAKGKVVMLLVFILGGAGAGFGFKSVIDAKLQEQPTTEPTPSDPQIAEGNGKENGVKKQDDVPSIPIIPPDKKGTVVMMSDFERVLEYPMMGPDGKPMDIEDMPWADEGNRNMVRAFFDKDSQFRRAMADEDKTDAEKAQLTAERHGELEAVQAWVRMADAERKKVYEADAMELPAELQGKPITKGYMQDGKVAIQFLLYDRCISCHEGNEEVIFSDTYESLKPFLEKKPVAK